MTQDDVRSDPQAEHALLAVCMESKTARAKARKAVIGSDFDSLVNERIWDAMGALDRADKDVDFVSVAAMFPAGTPEHATVLTFVGAASIPDHVETYAAIVRSWAIRRNVNRTAREALQASMSETENPALLAGKYAAKFTAIRDSGQTEDDFTAVTLAELLAEKDDEPDWLIPGLLERRDRLLLTGEEGLGKSHLLRQFAVHASAGAHPFDSMVRFKPIRAAIIDCENTKGQVRRKLRGTTDWVQRYVGDPTQNLMVDNLPRIDITRDRDLAKIHHLLDTWAPDLVVIGPLYRLYPKALQTDDDAAPVLAAIDSIRDRGIALLIEAHAGHSAGKEGKRDLRPRGSSALMGWPEFGFGLRSVAAGYADFVQWRGPREERAWPQRIRKADGSRWLPHGDANDYAAGIAS
ncbi:AAA family ATPase [Pimelobacter simplex]|uniref:Uncharacterized protein n=1 Tax=Nocardioides simplex TaxID=2045 RepID=A0A0C5XCL7_NOCSI|nr:AAA family ATPase [Pimelobacter simplex]AJR18524.1 hypothetical protein KR76_16695 [Pimelobacter simplex]MCG8152573.1 AAA family ATPase [Pimelobacter simplex]GEB17049.1 hypothetical protein NSI01_53640 [Pimelobacter simplex]SFM76786.1 replicative DNA helicase [Pimelobacter simplex]